MLGAAFYRRRRKLERAPQQKSAQEASDEAIETFDTSLRGGGPIESPSMKWFTPWFQVSTPSFKLISSGVSSLQCSHQLIVSMSSSRLHESSSRVITSHHQSSVTHHQSSPQKKRSKSKAPAWFLPRSLTFHLSL